MSLEGWTDPRLWPGLIKSRWKRHHWYLLAVTLIAILVRSIPGWIYAAWGNDFGIYFSITEDFAQNPQLFRPYSGWGASYNYFPVLYMITAALHHLTGASVWWLLPRVAPIFGGLSVLLFYFMVKTLTRDRTIALLAAAFLASNPFHIYQTSHAAPMTMGHFFMAMTLFLFFKARENHRYVGPLYISTILLIGSHHLTTFFFLISLLVVIFWENVSVEHWTQHFSEDFMFLVLASTMTFIYWMLVATPVYEGFISEGMPLSPWASLMLFYAGLLVLFLVVIPLRRRKWSWPRLIRTNVKNTPRNIIIMFLLSEAVIIPFAFISIPRTGFRFDIMAAVLLMPQIVTLGLVVSGFGASPKMRGGRAVQGWTIVLMLSFTITFITWHWYLIPYRHIEYLAYPFSILAALGVVAYGRYLIKKGFRHTTRFKAMLAFAVAVLILNTASAYAVQTSTSGYREDISNQVLEAADWLDGNGSVKGYSIATDHRISQVFYSRGYNVTSDYVYALWFEDNWVNCTDDLDGWEGKYKPVKYVVIDEVMREDGVQSNINETPRPIEDEAYAKFQQQPFSLVFRTQNKNGDRWVEVYEVDWGYVEANA